MQYRSLGNGGPQVSTVALGTMSWPGCNFGQKDFAEDPADYLRVREMVAMALECGMPLIDTAEGYGCGLAEDFLGRVMEELGCRDRIVIVTKAGPLFGEDKIDGRACDLSEANFMRRCEQSLKRLRTDCIDVFLAHWPDPLTPAEETMRAAEKLRAQGKIRAFGVSNYSNDQLAAALACGPVVTNQLGYSLVDRGIDSDKRPFCLKNGVGVMAYSPLGKGVLSGKYDATHLPPPEDYRHQRAHFAPENLPQHLAIAAKLREYADQLGCTPAQLALAWAIAQPGLSTVVPGAKSPEQVRLNAEAGDVVIPPGILEGLNSLK